MFLSDQYSLDESTRLRHIHLIGATGTGKTSLMENMIAQSAQSDEGFCFIDQHGDASERVLSLIPPHRYDQVVYIDLGSDRPIGLNFMAGLPLDQRPTATSAIESAFVHVFGETAVADRSRQILRNAVRTLMDTQDATLLATLKFLRDETYRTKSIDHCTDPVNKSFWTTEFASLSPSNKEDHIKPILNKLDAVLAFPSVRNVLSQTKNAIDLRRLIDDGGILLVNLNTGRNGHAAQLFGAFLVRFLVQAALSRSDTLEANRRPFFLYCDEFQNYANYDMVLVLQELRKYKLGLVAAHQFMSQLDRLLQDALFANVGTTVSFRVGISDYQRLGDNFQLETPTQLLDLENYHFFTRVSVNGRPFDAVTHKALPPADPLCHPGPLRKHAQRFGTPRARVEAAVARFLKS